MHIQKMTQFYYVCVCTIYQHEKYVICCCFRLVCEFVIQINLMGGGGGENEEGGHTCVCTRSLLLSTRTQGRSAKVTLMISTANGTLRTFYVLLLSLIFHFLIPLRFVYKNNSGRLILTLNGVHTAITTEKSWQYARQHNSNG